MARGGCAVCVPRLARQIRPSGPFPGLSLGRPTGLADGLEVTLAPGSVMPPVLVAGNGDKGDAPGRRDKLRGHAERTARAWSLDGVPLLGISVFALLGMPLEVLLRRRFASFRTIYLSTADELSEDGFEVLATAQRPHFTIRLERADDRELERTAGRAGGRPA